MKTSIVILNWNGAQYLRKFLPALIKYTQLQDTEIIVADNASTDDSLVVLENEFPMIRTIVLDKNYGFAEGYNKALYRLEADYFVLLNSDVEVTPGWLQPLQQHMDMHADTAACQPKIRSYNNKDYFEYAGASGGFIDKYGYPFCRGRVLGTLEKDKGQYDDTAHIFWATGACLMIRSDVFWEAGGLDAGFFAHMEEIDLCWRLRSRGYNIVCIPQSVVYHVGGGTLKIESPYKTYLNYRNNLLMLYKNIPDNRLRKVMFIRYFLDYISALHFLLKGRFGNFSQVFKARRDYKKMRPKYKAKRKQNLTLAKSSEIPQIYFKSLIFQYYFKGKKNYQKLMEKIEFLKVKI